MERGHPGEIYNIVDDHPISINDFLIYAASLMGAKRPFSILLWLLRWVMPYVAVFSSTRLLVSNQKAKRDIQWQPQFPSYREGLRQVIADKKK
jgi:nucleoside-diphosphate-sugar epimerase